jgi:hypothetical protein
MQSFHVFTWAVTIKLSCLAVTINDLPISYFNAVITKLTCFFITRSHLFVIPRLWFFFNHKYLFSKIYPCGYTYSYRHDLFVSYGDESTDLNVFRYIHQYQNGRSFSSSLTIFSSFNLSISISLDINEAKGV